MSRVKVLVFPCGSEVALEIRQALGLSVHVELHGASSTDDHGRFAFANYHHLSNIADASFDRQFVDLITRLGIQVVFATHDSVLEHLAPLAQHNGVYLVNGDPQTAAVTRRKSATYALFNGQPWLPTLFASVEQVTEWPIVLKPDQGQGGQGVTVATDRQQAQQAFDAMCEPVLCEYLPGEELTVDCFTDWRQRLLHVGPRSRERVRAGITMRSRSVPCSDEIRGIAEGISERLSLRGPWFFQIKQNRQGQWRLLEVCARLSSSSVAQRARGVNLPLMAIQDFLQRDQVVLNDARLTLVDRSLATVAQLDYEFDTAYLDFDDTLIIDGHANPAAMRFVYRLLELGKTLVLITRHDADIGASLEKARIAPQMFERIIHITDGRPKSAFVEGRAIFVDNHFPERLDVSRALGIPVFDVDALGLLRL